MHPELLAVAPEIFLAEVAAVVEQAIRATRFTFRVTIPELPDQRRRSRLAALVTRPMAGYQELRWDGRTLRAITNPITLRDRHGEPHDMGQFQVSISLDNAQPFVQQWANGQVATAHHPHVNNGWICFGNWRGTVQMAVEAEQYEAILLYAMEILDSYNPGSPYFRLEQRCGCGSGAERRSCQVCHRRGCEVCLLRVCVDCGSFACNRCRVECAACHNAVCHTCRRASPTGTWICQRCELRSRQPQAPRRRVA